MTPEIQKFIELLEGQLGYREKGDAYTKFGHWYGKHVEFDDDFTNAPWCDMYISWAAHKLGYEEWIGQFAWTVEHAKWFKKQGAWGKKPEVGAIVFYDWSGSNSIDRIDHVGVVTKVEGGRIHTIEGNVDGGVAKRKERDTSKVVGYGYPEKVKARLERKAQEKAGRVEGELPGESLSSLIPGGRIHSGGPAGHGDRSQGQVDGRLPGDGAQGRTHTGDEVRTQAPAKDQGPKQEAAPAPRSSSAHTSASERNAAPPRTSASEGAPDATKKAKHAKPTTADTTAATAEPLPTHTDAATTGPLPVIDSPTTLVSSALVAALALLAVARTRRLRVAAAVVAGPRTNRTRAAHRRHRKPSEGRLRRALFPEPTAQEPTLEPAALEPAALEPAALEPAAALEPTAILEPAAVLKVSTTQDGARRPRARHARMPLETRPFDLSMDGAGRRHALDPAAPGRAADVPPFTPAFDTDPYEPDFDRGRYAFGDETGPLEVVVDTGPLELVVDTGPFERIVIPGATSEFDAFSPPRRGENPSYRGRRRRHTGEEPLTLADLTPRGRRHRRAPEDDSLLVGAGGARRGRHRA
ncbi:CHAP domain-containing protein [Nonomuraea terrae]|uniref:CHAP domain-containing protein n=1 Tax=Nonomuraea terrae TaxID=2530383 RepID=A0A4R4XM93_9ACTN|nr:CHAP domain-containing protein [Nonomuraea terrae]TDD32173.1 CHAP domain-containing protein [Nonomuraea terrae]